MPLLHRPLLPSFILLFNISCATSPTTPTNDSQIDAFVKFDVQPTDAKKITIYVDEAYYGELDRWYGHIVRIPAGNRRVKIDSPGFLSQRFDFQLAPHSRSTFSITLEPSLDQNDDDFDTEQQKKTQSKNKLLQKLKF